jgi:hypothetical protein
MYKENNPPKSEQTFMTDSTQIIADHVIMLAEQSVAVLCKGN